MLFYKVVQISNPSNYIIVDENEKVSIEMNPILNRVYTFDLLDKKDIIEPTEAKKEIVVDKKQKESDKKD